MRESSRVTGAYGADENYRIYHLAVAAVAVSTGQNDSGRFQLDFRDEKYLPFEGAGVITGVKGHYLALSRGGKDIPVARALEHVFGYAVGIDMTRRDLQDEAKKMGRPWEVGKAFECAAPCSEIVPASQIWHPDRGAVWLKVNDTLRQQGDLNQLIWKVPEIIAYLSILFTLAPDDLIYSGTPSGVGPTVRGDILHGGVDEVGEIEITVQ